ncbi:hypothetical protein A9Q99_01875 [Gammaproteobacteria bacterium 45_16_T64]|nr:hypothetical protein A9Q99_01875 [Gammaproteobacteria bacterium 45_16_T64]
MSISEELNEIMSIQLVKTDGLLDKVISSLDDLLDTHSPDEILASMMGLKERYKQAELKARKSMSGGMGGEFHMAAALRSSYLNQSIKYIESANKCRQSD